MAGHSKWSNIKKKKEKTDAQRAKVFTKIGREISVCVREGGPDPTTNARLRDLIAKAKANNVPNDNIDRLIKKASGDGDKETYENIVYEGYGPNGVAVIVECLSDNRNRTASDIRHYFDKFGGNLGTTGCVSFMFTQKGVIIAETGDRDEEEIMEDCFEAGAEDFTIEDGEVEFLSESGDFTAVRDYITEKGYTILSAEIEQIPSTYTKLEDEELITKMTKLLDALEDNDDVQDVWHNWEYDGEE